ncbi:MAG TPA: methylglutaconyl-CoA hydratase [Bacteroidetes bacterium]|jgi:methylglutaconyl-CoA hydratase|nr:methylglutaconyl-CoA hydratase [Bacteroidota bacterium]
MKFTRLLYNVSDRTARITLNRPEKRNALDDTMVKELTLAFVSAGKDQNVKVVVLAGAGTAFCAGADLDYLSKVSQFDLEENRADSQQLANLFRVIHELRKPIIAMVNGPALAGGCGLASVCDIIIASEENATFGYTEVRIGFIPAVVMIFLLKRVGEGIARELILRGNILSALDAKKIGLVNMVVRERELEATTSALCTEIIQHNSGTAMGLCKEMFSKLQGLNLMEALDFAANMNAAARMTPDCKRGVAAFLKKEKLQW